MFTIADEPRDMMNIEKSMGASAVGGSSVSEFEAFVVWSSDMGSHHSADAASEPNAVHLGGRSGTRARKNPAPERRARARRATLRDRWKRHETSRRSPSWSSARARSCPA
jgi:hypothetical protein